MVIHADPFSSFLMRKTIVSIRVLLPFLLIDRLIVVLYCLNSKIVIQTISFLIFKCRKPCIAHISRKTTLFISHYYYRILL